MQWTLYDGITEMMIMYAGMVILLAFGCGFVLGRSVGRAQLWRDFEEWKHKDARVRQFVSEREHGNGDEP